MTQSGPATFNPLAVAQQTLDTPLSRLLADRIQREGPISFADWMEACLYHPQHGYYRRGKPTVGRDGDFLTSPEVHPLFGAAVGHVAVEIWRQTAVPETFQIAEVGPGTGALAESMLRHLDAIAPKLAAATRYTMVEPDPVSAEQQSRRLGTVHSERMVRQIRSLDQLSGGHHLVIANELLDALPVHRLIFQEGRWRELLVGFSSGDGFHDVTAELNDQSLLRALVDLRPSERQIVEIAPDRASIVSEAGRCRRGPRSLVAVRLRLPPAPPLCILATRRDVDDVP